jgi:hypothetical protein
MPEPLHATSIRALAKRLGVSPTTVQRDLAAEYGDLDLTPEGESSHTWSLSTARPDQRGSSTRADATP